MRLLPCHGGSVNASVVSGPTDIHDRSGHQLHAVGVARNGVDLAQGSNSDLRREDDGFGVGASD